MCIFDCKDFGTVDKEASIYKATVQNTFVVSPTTMQFLPFLLLAFSAASTESEAVSSVLLKELKP